MPNGKLPSRLSLIKLATPIALAQAATATAGIVDTFVIGASAGKVELAGVGIGSVIINFLFWAFGFLRMSTTGFVAQAIGRGDEKEANASLLRALMIGCGFGLLLNLLFPFFGTLPLKLFDATPEVYGASIDYIQGRIFGAPAALILYGIMGYLTGRGTTGQLLALQVLINSFNALFDFIAVFGLDWGVRGVAYATSFSDWCGLFFGLYLVRHHLFPIFPLEKNLFDKKRLRTVFSANSDIMIRTVSLMLGFAFFTRQSTSVGTAFVAANEVLLQFITVSAFFLDALAWVGEKEVGEAVGQENRTLLKGTILRLAELSGLLALLFSIIIFFTGPLLVETLIKSAMVQEVAKEFIPYCAAIPILGVWAYLLDGIFIGAMNGRLLRNASLVSTATYIALNFLLIELTGNQQGIWIAFILFYILRAATLSLGLPKLLNPPVTH